MLEQPKKVYIVGIGGIGISALARYLHERRFALTGSDLVESEITQALAREGITIHIGRSADGFSVDTELLIYSNAVPADDPQRQKAVAAGIPQLSYPEALGEIAENYKVIAICGTNGKTTTTAMVGVVLSGTAFDPTVIVGSKVNAWGTNFRHGKSEWLVAEADEYRRAFLNLSPDVLVITNIEADHLDYYKDLADIKSAFRELVWKMKPGGVLIYNYDDENAREVVSDYPWRKISFGFEEGDFNLHKFSGLKLKLPGKHNQANALAAAAVCKTLGIDSEAMILGLNNFTGTWRRFQMVGKHNQTEIISDYAHHPKGLAVTLAAAGERYPPENTLVVFQPHQHNRTAKLLADFVKSLLDAPQTDFILTEIFDVAGRASDEEREQISSRQIAEEISKHGKNAAFAKDLVESESLVRQALGQKPYKAVIIIGAGDIYKIANKLSTNPKP